MTDLKPLDVTKPSGPVFVRDLQINIDRDLCIGAATCAAVAPKAFHVDAEAKAIVLESAAEETDEALVEAARSCPVAAIIIKDEKGDKIFPK